MTARFPAPVKRPEKIRLLLDEVPIVKPLAFDIAPDSVNGVDCDNCSFNINPPAPAVVMGRLEESVPDGSVSIKAPTLLPFPRMMVAWPMAGAPMELAEPALLSLVILIDPP